MEGMLEWNTEQCIFRHSEVLNYKLLIPALNSLIYTIVTDAKNTVHKLYFVTVQPKLYLEYSNSNT